MFAGHYTAALAAKYVSPKINLGILFAAAQFLDVLWAGLVLLNVERMRIIPHFTATNPYDFYFMPYSHSLMAAGLWSIAVLAVSRRFATLGQSTVLGLAVLSHWLLDFLVHKPDLTLTGAGPRLGLSLWNHAAVSMILEFGLFLGGIALYVKSTAPRNRWGEIGVAALAIGLPAIQLIVFFGPAPPSSSALAALALFGYIVFAAAAGWVDLQRKSRTASAAN